MISFEIINVFSKIVSMHPKLANLGVLSALAALLTIYIDNYAEKLYDIFRKYIKHL